MLVVALAAPRVVAAQETTVPGTITGSITLATPDAELGEAALQLIAFPEGGQPDTADTATTTDGSFEFDVEAEPTTSYFVLVEYEGIQYLSNPLLISADLPTVAADFEVYATSTEAPGLAIDSTTITVLAIDRQRAELTLVREDQVRQDEPFVFVGDDDGITLRLPLPDGTVSAGGFDDSATYVQAGGTLTVGQPLRPGVTTVVTSYTVRYEPNDDEYRLRVTAPVGTEQVEVRVPERFVREVQPADDAGKRGEDDEFEGEPLIVIERTLPATPGQSLVVDLVGLSGADAASHPFTSGVGAVIGAALALLVVAGLAFALQRQRDGASA